jgi:ribosome recycling factor
MAYDFNDFHQKAQKTIDYIRTDIGSLRTGRASAQMLDPVKVEAYGTMMKMNEVANVSAPDPSLLVISPWDKSLISLIEKAISTSGLNLHPIVDGAIIRIAVPSLTEERRKEMVKLLHQKIENGRVMMRNVRGDIRKEIEKLESTGGVSEDEIKKDLQDLDKHTKDYMDQIDQISADKEKELMTI